MPFVGAGWSVTAPVYLPLVLIVVAGLEGLCAD